MAVAVALVAASANSDGIAGTPQTSGTRPVLTLQTGHVDTITAIEFSPDDQLLLSASLDGSARLWHVETRSALRVFEGAHTQAVLDVDFSPSGERIATAGRDGVAVVWQTVTGVPVLRLEGDGTPVVSIAFSADDRFLLTGGRDGSVRLWNAATGAEVHHFLGSSASAAAVAFSADSRVAIVAFHDSTIRRWEVATGIDNGMARLNLLSGTMETAVFSQTGDFLFTASTLTSPTIWDAQNGARVREFALPAVHFVHTAFSRDNLHVTATAKDGSAVVWNIHDGQAHKLGSSGQPVATSAIALSHDAKHVAAALLGTAANTPRLRLWDSSPEAVTFDLGGQTASLLAIAASDRQMFVVNADNGVEIWSVSGNHITRPIPVSRPRGVRVSRDGTRVLTTDATGAVTVWNATSGRSVRLPFVLSRNDVVSAFSHDGRFVVTAPASPLFVLFGFATAAPHRVRIWNADTGALVREFQAHAGAMSPDGRHFATAESEEVQFELGRRTGYRGLVRIWDLDTGTEVRSVPIAAYTLAYSANGRIWLATPSSSLTLLDVTTGSEERSVQIRVSQGRWSVNDHYVLVDGITSWSLWDLNDGRLVFTFDDVRHVAFFPDGQHILTGHRDGTLRIWDLRNGVIEERAQLASFRDHSWAVIDRVGRFDVSRERDVTGLHWVAGLEPIALDQLRDRYYQPHLLASIMGLSPEPLRDVRTFNERGIALYPKLVITPPTAASPELRVVLQNQGGGIGRVQVFVNDKELSSDVRAAGTDPAAATATVRLDLANHPFLIAGMDNVIEVRAYNRDQYLSSRGLKVIYRPPSRSSGSPTLWAVIAGVSDYQGSSLDLRFAAKDADDFARALEIGATRLFGAEKTRIRLLTTSPGRERPLKANLTDALRELTRSAATDIVVVYLAGHGITHGGAEGDFFFLTGEAASAMLADPDVRSQTALSSTEIARFIGQTSANKQVLILDTCHAGRAVEKLSETRQIPASQIRALDRLKERFGMFVLAGSAADAVSYETSRYGQGLLTYSLLMGMRGAALRDDSYVDVGPLMNFAADKVEELARGIGGVQRPVLALPRGGSSFDLGRLTPEDKTHVPLALKRPLVLRASFQDERRVIDHLSLTRHVNEQLRHFSQSDAARMMFVDASEFPDAYVITGRYRVDSSNVTAQVLLFRDEKSIGEVHVTGTVDALDKLAASIVSAVLGFMK